MKIQKSSVKNVSRHKMKTSAYESPQQDRVDCDKFKKPFRRLRKTRSNLAWQRCAERTKKEERRV